MRRIYDKSKVAHPKTNHSMKDITKPNHESRDTQQVVLLQLGRRTTTFIRSIVVYHKDLKKSMEETTK